MLQCALDTFSLKPYSQLTTMATATYTEQFLSSFLSYDEDSRKGTAAAYE